MANLGPLARRHFSSLDKVLVKSVTRKDSKVLSEGGGAGSELVATIRLGSGGTGLEVESG